jgi:hypothetical protein
MCRTFFNNVGYTSAGAPFADLYYTAGSPHAELEHANATQAIAMSNYQKAIPGTHFC